MPKSNVSAANARPEPQIFAELSSLCTAPGYIHAIAYFSWRDNFIRYEGPKVVAKDMAYQHSHDKLIRTEISTLIGLMVRRSVDVSLQEPSVFETYIERTEVLLNELHLAMAKPWFEGWNPSAGETPQTDHWGSAAAMREPIFYGGESAYGFQYRDFARPKYRDDDGWLDANKGFRIDDACQIGEALGKLQSHRLIECHRSLRKQAPDQWTMLPGFEFTVDDVTLASGVSPEKVDHFLTAFSCDENERNTSFTGLSEINITNFRPILKMGSGSYILLQHFSLLEAIYEAPFFWMTQDAAYRPQASTNRGRFTESFVAHRLEAIFGTSRVMRNVEIYKGKNRFAEADVLVLHGDRAIVVQAKSKRLTIEARKGNDLQLKGDFQRAVQDAYDQALLCAEALTTHGFRFVASSGAEIPIVNQPLFVFPICAVSDHYPALAFQARQFLKVSNNFHVQPPLIADVFAIDAITEMLDKPLHFLNYIAVPARFDDKIFTPNELTTLGLHLSQNLWFDSKLDGVALDESLASNLDIAMLARRAGVPGDKTPSGILTRFQRLTLGRLLTEIETIASPQLTGLGLLLLQFGPEAARSLNAGIDRIVRQAKLDGKNHDISMGVGEAALPGVTVHCNGLADDVAREQLFVHCNARKYDAQANAWYGLLLNTNGGIRAALALEHDWKPDSDMDRMMKSWPKRQPIPISQVTSGKIGRNSLCFCGSGKKYKRCCLST